MDVKKIIADLKKRGEDFTVCTDVMYGRGINGVGFDTYSTHSEIGPENSPKTNVYRSFKTEDDCLVITERYVYPEIPWRKEPRKTDEYRTIYLGYDKIAYISTYKK